MYRLVIAEKPSVAMGIAQVLGATARKEGHMEGNGWLVSWCVGHLAGLAEPAAYNPDYAKWRREDLPILPESWCFTIGQDKRERFDILRTLLRREDVSEVVNACDAGREGELIFRTAYHLAGCTKPVNRLWISSMEDSAIREGFANLRPGGDYDGLHQAALERVVRKSISAIKNRLIRLAAQRNYPTPETLCREFQEVGLTTDFSRSYRVVLFTFDTGGDGDADTQIMKYALENMIQEVLVADFQVETYSFTGDSLLSVAACEGVAPEQVEEGLFRCFQQIYEYVQRYFGVHISASLSPANKGIGQFPQAVADCRKIIGTSGGQETGTLLTESDRLRPEIQEIKRYVTGHIGQEFTVARAAQMCSMSESYFSHIFKKEMGISFVDYVNQQKVRAAEKLLLHTDLRIGEIAAEIGVDNPNYFSVLFKKVWGESPQAFRRRRG